ncbi:hypothetical protein [Oceanobacter antarcticus]|uniref:Uncharacterized protein n=1 Tax=Oceanobacter antarcticus TaxID=3133425 RepID=A0ABW8NDZ7_9GAMM
MTSEFDAINKAADEQRRTQNLDDFNNEMAGRDTGRIKRFGFDQARQDATEDKKRKQSAFEQLMMNPVYREAWTNAMNAVNQAEEAVYHALIQASDTLHEAQSQYQDLLDKAALTDDGQRVFKDKHGEVYTEDGDKLSADEAAQIDWRGDDPSREDQTHRQDALTTAQKEFDRINGHSNRLVEIREEMTAGKSSPLSLDEIQAMEKEALKINDSLDLATVSYDSDLNREAPQVAPNLTFTF